MQVVDSSTIRNGVDTQQLFGTLDAVKAQPEIAAFTWRVSNEWLDGAHNRSSIKGFYAALGEDTSRAEAFIVDAGEPAILCGTDTGPNPAFWRRIAQFPVAHVVVETAFSEAESALASASGHHCPSSLAAELAGAPADARIYITHIKPGEIAAVMTGLRELKQERPLMELLRGDVFDV